MANLLTRVNELHERLRNAELSESNSFSMVFDNFLELTETTELMDASNPFEDQLMNALLEQVVRRHANDGSLTLRQCQMLEYAPAGLIHGMIMAGRRAGTFFYSLKDQQGIVAFAEAMSMMHYYRITATMLPAGSTIGRKRWTIN
jgi:hypothetical protein